MTVRPRHVLLADGRVELHVGGSVTAVSAERAKAFAWGLLADLDPDEAVVTAAQCEQAADARRAMYTGHAAVAILAAIRDGETTSNTISAVSGVGLESCRSRLSQLKADGLVAADGDYGPGAPRSWRLTVAGAAWLDGRLRALEALTGGAA